MMKFTSKLMNLATGVLLFMTLSCQNEDLTTDQDNAIDTSTNAVTDPELLAQIASLEIDNRAVTKKPFHLPDGSVETRIFLGNDIALTTESIKEMAAAVEKAKGDNGLGQKQYRTEFLVRGANRTIDILGYTGNDEFGLSQKAQTGLRYAVDNFNNLRNSSLRFRLTYGTNFEAADMVVFDNTQNNPNNVGGVAGFPDAEGRPNKFVQIYNMEPFSTNANELVILHEIGHSIGFRHTDWFSRSVCPPDARGNEGGFAQLIPGTPSGVDSTSFMIACFNPDSDGEFNANDRIAVETLY